MSHLFPLLGVFDCNLADDISDPADETGPFRHTDSLAGIKQVETVRAFQAVVIGRQDQPLVQQFQGFALAGVEQRKQKIDVGFFVIEG